MRIGITGSHGTGKTTLARALSEHLGISLITEQARSVARRMGIKDCSALGNNLLTASFQRQVLLAQIKAEEKAGRDWVSDRTTLDCLAYWYLYGLSGLPETELYAEACLGNMRRYDLIIYVPAQIQTQADGFRLTDEASQEFVDQFVRDKLEQVPHVEVYGGPQERLAQVLAHVNQLCGKRGDPVCALSPCRS